MGCRALGFTLFLVGCGLRFLASRLAREYGLAAVPHSLLRSLSRWFRLGLFQGLCFPGSLVEWVVGVALFRGTFLPCTLRAGERALSGAHSWSSVGFWLRVFIR